MVAASTTPQTTPTVSGLCYQTRGARQSASSECDQLFLGPWPPALHWPMSAAAGFSRWAQPARGLESARAELRRLARARARGGSRGLRTVYKVRGLRAPSG